MSGKEDPSLELPPAIDALVRVFKRVIGIADGAADGTQAAAAPGVCAARLLVPGAQAINLIGKQGATIKSIQESTGATIRVISVGKVLLASMLICHCSGTVVDAHAVIFIFYKFTANLVLVLAG